MNKGLNFSYSLDSIDQAAQFVLNNTKHNVWLLQGEMGSGKTTLAKAIGKALGVVDVVNSPTFSLINEYITDKGEPLYHFDFYRIEAIREAEDMGAEDYFYSGHLCLIEWSERVVKLLPPQFSTINITLNEDNSRMLLLF